MCDQVESMGGDVLDGGEGRPEECPTYESLKAEVIRREIGDVGWIEVDIGGSDGAAVPMIGDRGTSARVQSDPYGLGSALQSDLRLTSQSDARNPCSLVTTPPIFVRTNTMTVRQGRQLLEKDFEGCICHLFNRHMMVPTK